MKNLKFIWVVLALVLVLIVALLIFNQDSSIDEQPLVETPEVSEEIVDNEENWRNIEFEDVLTGQKYTISQFSKPVFLESFAVWCPTCKRQQEIIKELHQEIGDDAVSIALDTDPNEVASQVINHANENGFDWIFAISPIEMTQSLIDEFGVGVVNAPSAPIVLVCSDGNARLLDRGLKSAEELKEELNTC